MDVVAPGFGQLTLILSPHYRVKCRSHNSTVYCTIWHCNVRFCSYVGRTSSRVYLGVVVNWTKLWQRLTVSRTVWAAPWPGWMISNSESALYHQSVASSARSLINDKNFRWVGWVSIIRRFYSPKRYTATCSFTNQRCCKYQSHKYKYKYKYSGHKYKYKYLKLTIKYNPSTGTHYS